MIPISVNKRSLNEDQIIADTQEIIQHFPICKLTLHLINNCASLFKGCSSVVSRSVVLYCKLNTGNNEQKMSRDTTTGLHMHYTPLSIYILHTSTCARHMCMHYTPIHDTHHISLLPHNQLFPFNKLYRKYVRLPIVEVSWCSKLQSIYLNCFTKN